MDITKPEHIGTDLLSAMLEEIKILEKPWQEMSQREQNEVIDRLRSRIYTNVEQALFLMSAEERPCLVARVEKVEFKAGLKATLNISRENPNRHDLADSVGQQVIIIVSESADAYTGGMEEVEGDPDQGELEGVI